MAPALVPEAIGQEAAACALLGAAMGGVRAFLPGRGRAAFLPDLFFVGALLLGVQAYAATLSAGGVLRWYMLASAFFCAFGVEKLAGPPLRRLERWGLWLLGSPLRLGRRWAAPLVRARRARAAEAKARRTAKRTAKKPKKNLPREQRLLYNSNVSK